MVCRAVLGLAERHDLGATQFGAIHGKELAGAVGRLHLNASRRHRWRAPSHALSLGPVHGGSASNIRVENMGSKMNFTFNACCDGLKQAIAARLR